MGGVTISSCLSSISLVSRTALSRHSLWGMGKPARNSWASSMDDQWPLLEDSTQLEVWREWWLTRVKLPCLLPNTLLQLKKVLCIPLLVPRKELVHLGGATASGTLWTGESRRPPPNTARSLLLAVGGGWILQTAIIDNTQTAKFGKVQSSLCPAH